MRTLTTLNAEPAGGEVRIESLRGKEWLVAPVVLVREGVLNGGFLGFDEIEKSAVGWNGRPVTAPPAPDSEAANLAPGEPSGHPIDGETNGRPNFVSANREPFVEDMAAGMVMNVEARTDLPTPGDEMSDRGLVGEAWFDLERAEQVGESAVETVETIAEGGRLDVSTGYFHRPVETQGTHDGERYEVEQTDILPDHLAALPNETGACSWPDGCGAPYPEGEANEAATQAAGGPAPGLAMAANQSEGDLVEWSARGGTAYGEIVEVRESEDAEPFDDEIDGDAGPIGPPAALITVYRPDGDEWRETDTQVAHRTDTDTLTVIDEFPEPNAANAVSSANLLDEAREPTYSGLEMGEVPDSWPPGLSDYMAGLDMSGDGSTVDDLDMSEREAIAERSLLGDPEGDTIREVSFFPTTNPSTNALVENALEAVISGRGSQADITDEQLASARAVAYELLNDEFGRDLDVPDDLAENTYEANDASLTARAGAFAERVRGLLTGDDGESAASNDESGPCSCDHSNEPEPNRTDDDTTTQNMEYTITELAAMSAFDAEALRDMSEERLATLAESLDDGDDGTTANTNNDGSTDDELLDRLAELERQVEAQAQEKRERLAETVAANTDHDAEELAANTDEFPTPALETLAETVEQAETSQGYEAPQGNRVNYAAQAGGTEGDDGGEDATEATANVGALAAIGEGGSE